MLHLPFWIFWSPSAETGAINNTVYILLLLLLSLSSLEFLFIYYYTSRLVPLYQLYIGATVAEW